MTATMMPRLDRAITGASESKWIRVAPTPDPARAVRNAILALQVTGGDDRDLLAGYVPTLALDTEADDEFSAAIAHFWDR